LLSRLRPQFAPKRTARDVRSNVCFQGDSVAKLVTDGGETCS
jgi:hypothetical protein